MARQKSERPKTRTLVRWNEDMDKKLLLTIQWACNKKGVKIPWEMVGYEMGETITESAVVQHLAKLRQRMVSDNLPVPPALTRGGRNNQTEEKKGPAQRVTKRTVNKNKSAQDIDEESDADETYGSEVENNAARKHGKGKKKAMSKSRIKKESSSPNHILAGSGSESDDNHGLGQQSYAVGDAMWDLDTKTHAPSEGTHSTLSSPSPYQPTKIVALKIGREGFARLGLSAQMKGSKSNDSDDYGHPTSEGSLDISGSPNDGGAMYDKSHNAASYDGSFNIGVGDAIFDGYERHTDVYARQALHGEETESRDHDNLGFPGISQFEGQPGHSAMLFSQTDGGAIDEGAADGMSAARASNRVNIGVNNGSGLTGVPRSQFDTQPQHVTNHNIPSMAYGAVYGVVSMPTAADGNFGAEDPGMPATDHKHTTVMTPLDDHFNQNNFGFFKDGYCDANMSGFEGSNGFIANHYGAPMGLTDNHFNAAFNDDEAVYQDLSLAGDSHTMASDVGVFSNGIEDVAGPVTAADDTGLSGIQNVSLNPQFAPADFMHAEGYGYGMQTQHTQPQHVGNQVAGSGYPYPSAHDYDSLRSAKSFKPNTGEFSGFVNNVPGVYYETPQAMSRSQTEGGKFFSGF
ncbi:MAG: hypothetical protein Q9225_006661 [Loekoesia sp. 1 TL-2023]